MLLVSVSVVFCVREHTREAVKYTLNELSSPLGKPLTARARAGVSISVGIRERATNGWLQWAVGWLGVVGVVDSSQWSQAALLLPLQMTTRRRPKPMLRLSWQTKCRLQHWGWGWIALDWFLLWQAHAVRQIKWPSHNNNNNNNSNNNNNNNCNNNEGWQAIKCCMLQMWPRADRNRKIGNCSRILLRLKLQQQQHSSNSNNNNTVYVCVCINPARTSLWRNSIDSAPHSMKLSFSVRY